MDQTSELLKALLMLWGESMKDAGRIEAVRNYFNYCKDVRGYMNYDDVSVILALLGSNDSNETTEEFNDTEKETNETERKEEETE